jgi:hypothetical protein
VVGFRQRPTPEPCERNTERYLMSSKPRLFKCKLVNPRTARRKNCECSDCGLRYTTRDYKVLYEAHKIIYLLYPASTNKTYCHECLFHKVSTSLRGGEKYAKLLVKDVDGDYTLSIERED